jgi:acetolactate synthase small subunit
MLDADKHVLSILVDNQPGVLSRISGFLAEEGLTLKAFAWRSPRIPRFPGSPW